MNFSDMKFPEEEYRGWHIAWSLASAQWIDSWELLGYANNRNERLIGFFVRSSITQTELVSRRNALRLVMEVKEKLDGDLKGYVDKWEDNPKLKVLFALGGYPAINKVLNG